MSCNHISTNKNFAKAIDFSDEFKDLCIKLITENILRHSEYKHVYGEKAAFFAMKTAEKKFENAKEKYLRETDLNNYSFYWDLRYLTGGCDENIDKIIVALKEVLDSIRVLSLAKSCIC